MMNDKLTTILNAAAAFQTAKDAYLASPARKALDLAEKAHAESPEFLAYTAAMNVMEKLVDGSSRPSHKRLPPVAGSVGKPVSHRVMDALVAHPAGLTWTQLADAVGPSTESARRAALKGFVQAKKVEGPVGGAGGVFRALGLVHVPKTVAVDPKPEGPKVDAAKPGGKKAHK